MGMWIVCILFPSSFFIPYVDNYRPNGTRFVAAAGTTEFARRWSPKEGDIVSFKHHGYLEVTGKPKLPTLYRMRTDLTWDDVINNIKDHKFKPNGNRSHLNLNSHHFKSYLSSPSPHLTSTHFNSLQLISTHFNSSHFNSPQNSSPWFLYQSFLCHGAKWNQSRKSIGRTSKIEGSCYWPLPQNWNSILLTQPIGRTWNASKFIER